MTASVGDVVAQLRAVLESLDAAVVTALRAQADADQAKAHFTEVATGTDHSKIRAAVTASQTASEKVARYARLLAKANESLTIYLNTIAPGSAPTHQASDGTAPSGERLVAEAENASSGVAAFLRRQVKKADDTQDTLKQVEQAVTTGLKELLREYKEGPGPTANTTATTSPGADTQVARPTVDHPVAGVVMAVGAVAVGTKGLWNMIKKRRERKHDEDQARDGRVHPDDGEGGSRSQRSD
ncbi:hypothetical protein AB0J90_29630 [Micromonospora sp. NPDC049523]|uniref:hypothetical protein n=1 Tax=Micromonospora sp. NPDC049523 TaxID=3155921 RepID=UPI00342DD0C7